MLCRLRHNWLFGHAAMVAKFLDDNKPKTWICTVPNFIDLSHFQFVKCWRNFLGLNSKGPSLSLEKEQENFCVLFTYFIKRRRETSKFHVAVVQRQRRNVKKQKKKRDACAKLLFCYSKSLKPVISMEFSQCLTKPRSDTFSVFLTLLS